MSVVWKWHLPSPGAEPEPSQGPAEEAERVTGPGISLCRQGAGFAWSLWEVTEAQQVDEVQDWEWEVPSQARVTSEVVGDGPPCSPGSGLRLPYASSGSRWSLERD